MDATVGTGVNGRRAFVAGAALVLVAGLLAYANALGAVFLFDDHAVVLENRSLLHPTLASLLRPELDSTLTGRPLLALVFAANLRACGPSAPCFHAVNVAIHLAAALLLYALVRAVLLSAGRSISGATAFAASAAALWAVHPVTTAAVTFVSQRAESLAAALILGILLAAHHGSSGARRWDVLAVALAWIGVLVKETVVVAPAIALLVDAAVHRTSLLAAARRRWPTYLALFASWVPLAALAIANPRSHTVGFHLLGVTPLDYLRTQFGVVLHYVVLALRPWPLVFDYGALESGVKTVRTWGECALPALAIAALVGASFVAWRKRPLAGVAALSFFGLLAPTSTVLVLAVEPEAEHRTYLALACVVLLVVAAADALIGKLSGERWRATIAAALAAGALLSFGALTRERNEAYRDETGLWRATLAERPENGRAHFALGNALGASGEATEAIAELRHGSRLGWEPPGFFLALGHAYELLGRDTDAEWAYRRGTEKEPKAALLHGNLGNVLARAGKLEEAAAEERRAVELDPEAAVHQFNLAGVLARLHDYRGSLDAYSRALGIDPTLARAHERAGVVASWAGDPEQAIRHFEAALQLDPRLTSARVSLAWLLATHPDEAVRAPQRAATWLEGIPEDQRSARFLETKAAIAAEQADFTNALALASRALALDPSRAPALDAELAAYRTGRPWREDPRRP